jgi:hypothetical protein
MPRLHFGILSSPRTELARQRLSSMGSRTIRMVSMPLDQRLEPGQGQLHSAGLLSFGPSDR